ncbi:Dolichyl-diphosphooligosaccharide--protein glycosyltransferase subunit 1 [Golovinomyces cichoracearum]|uniref:Dolichyl-diphosphooligosaccharide--protein glycosyltransferase subunit 1 n=1 Tax=Golovinomyces cichoracearum TaxID=62708 RepID=A0A420IGP2_9PEZI|nr:Dolichyl-diphosphooligosaccharide--protein glycosyltransferase subunit 1 [Golovinomyces cichoracearum]
MFSANNFVFNINPKPLRSLASTPKMKGAFLAAFFFLFPFLTQCVELNTTNALIEPQNVLQSPFTPPLHFRNTNLVHIISLEKNFPRETINAVIENVASSAQDEYYIPFKSEQMKAIGTLEVKDRNDLDKGPLAVQVVKVDSEREVQFYRVKLPKPLAPNAQMTLGITYSYLSSLTPKPRTIPQVGNQFLEYKFSAVAYSSYTTLNQKTEVKFINSNVPDYTKIPRTNDNNESPTKTGSKLTYGPFRNIQSETIKPVKVRYQFTKPLIHISKLERDIEISHWGGNIAFEERYTLINKAANLSKLFSRVEWASTVFYNPPTTAIKELKIPLRAGSTSPYFVDTIGNVSTSRFRTNMREASLEIKPRYPVFGGWKYPFRIGWDADLKKYLRKLDASDGYVLNVPFLQGPKQEEGSEYEIIQTRVILPEGSTNIKYSTMVPIVSANISLYKTYMDTIGRTSLTLTAVNVFDEQRDWELIVTYDYPLAAALRKPLVFFLGFLSLFVTAWTVGSLDINIRAKANR